MANYKIIASDLDGTLLNNAGGISRENYEAIHTLSERGVQFVPTSGRTYSDMPEFLLHHPDIRYFIYSDGAAVYDRQTGERIEMGIPNALSKQILDILFCYDIHITYRHKGIQIADRAFQTEEMFAYYDVMQRHREVVEQYAVYVDDFKERIYAADPVEMFAVYFHDLTEMAECRERLHALGGLHIAELVYNNFEIYSEKAGKGIALEKLAQKLGVLREETIGIGDSDNDIALIRSAGRGLAVSNALPTLKAAADAVICSNEENVLSYILSHDLADAEEPR